MSSETTPEEITVKLPSYLAKWLKLFAKDLAMTPDQLLANILSYYYEAWRIGYEKYVAETLTSSPQTLVEEVIASNKELRKKKWLIESFLRWTAEKNIKMEEIDSKHVEKFLEEYVVKKGIKKTTLHKYRQTLRLFIKELKGNPRRFRGKRGLNTVSLIEALEESIGGEAT